MRLLEAGRGDADELAALLQLGELGLELVDVVLVGVDLLLELLDARGRLLVDLSRQS